MILKKTAVASGVTHAPPREAVPLLPQLENQSPSVLRYLRYLLKVQPILRSDWDTLDFFQELSARYMLRLGSRNFQNKGDKHSNALIRKLARHLTVDQLRHLRAQRRDILKREFMERIPDHSKVTKAVPIDQMVARETLDKIQSKLSKTEWEILRLKGEGFGWVEIANLMGKKPNGIRMKFNRLTEKLAKFA